ncbi:flavin reductase [Novosphingobium olei]|uniref:flavin reductase n=1 Tax=Novosphingobium olei TaxID=2728851 RepID=UPI0030919577|nr:flavin reductase [Novosphingobium olei]
MTDSEKFRDAMWRLGAAVNIITTDGAAGRHGITASAVCRLSDDPAAVLLSVNRSGQMHGVLRANRKLCINVLGGEHEELSNNFASRRLEASERFGMAAWEEMENGTPALVGALCSLGCRVDTISETGTHSVFVCHVEEIRFGPAQSGLMHFGRRYHRLAIPEAA